MTRKVYVCLWAGHDLPGYSGNQYGSLDVMNLSRNVRRRIPDGQLHLFVDDHYERAIYDENPPELKNVVTHSFNGVGCGGWSHSFEAFHPEFWPQEGERIIWTGLDTVILRDPSWLYDWDKHPVGLPLDPYQGKYRIIPCDAVVSYNREGAKILWEAYLEAKKNRMADYLMAHVHPSEMMLMRALFKTHEWETLEPEPKRLLSYKAHVLPGGNYVKPPLSGADIVYFHGRPKLPDISARDPVKAEWLLGAEDD